MLARVSVRAAWVTAAVAFAVSIAAAALSPQDVGSGMAPGLGAWVRLVIWHGMLKWACIAGIFVMGALAVYHLVAGSDEAVEWARALQAATLPLWAFAVFVGAAAAKLVWGSWNLTERRMTMSLVYTMVAAGALIAALSLDRKKAVAILVIVTSVAMAAGLVWVALGLAGEDVHPASAVMSSEDASFKVFAAVMMASCLVGVLALAVPTRGWLTRVATDHGHDAPG